MASDPSSGTSSRRISSRRIGTVICTCSVTTYFTSRMRRVATCSVSVRSCSSLRIIVPSEVAVLSEPPAPPATAAPPAAPAAAVATMGRVRSSP